MEGFDAEYTPKALEMIRRQHRFAMRKATKLEVFYDHFVSTLPNYQKAIFMSTEEIASFLNEVQGDQIFNPTVLGRELRMDGLKRYSREHGKRKGYFLRRRSEFEEEAMEKFTNPKA